MVIKGEVEKNDWLDTDGSFFAKLVGVSERDGEFSPVVQFLFEIIDDSDNEGKQVTGMSSKKVTPDNKTSQWLSALDTDFEFEIGKEFDFESFVGKVCRILVAEKESKGRTYFNIVKIRALKPEESKKLKAVEEKAEKKETKKETKKSETKPSKVDDDDIDF